MPPTTNANFPSLEDILNQVRAIANDAFAGASNTPGEGQILTDFVPNASGSGFTTTNNPFTLNHLNSAIRELYRKIRITGDALLIQDNYIWTATPVVDGPLGSAVQDPTIQEWVDSTGWWDGSAYTNTLILPTDMYLPIRLWERTTDTTDSFVGMTLVSDGLSPRPQGDTLGQWEYRNGAIYFVGSTTSRDVRMRYASLFPTFFDADLDFNTTLIPVLDCQEFVAYKTAEKIALALGDPTISNMLANTAAGHLFDLKNERVRRMQYANDIRRPGYNDENTGASLDLYGI